jgi:hypothetical protein
MRGGSLKGDSSKGESSTFWSTSMPSMKASRVDLGDIEREEEVFIWFLMVLSVEDNVQVDYLSDDNRYNALLAFTA